MTRSTGEGPAPGSEETASPREAAKAERRERLLDSAKRLFARHGFHAVRLGDIGMGAGVSGPAVYRHFESKEAVLTELLVGISEYLHDGGIRIIEGHRHDGEAAAGPASAEAPGAPEPLGGPGQTRGPEPSQVLARLIDFHVEFAMQEPELIRIQDRDLDALPDDARRRVRRLQRQYVTAWAEVVHMALPELTKDEATVRVHALFGMVNSTPHLGRELPAHAVTAQLRLTARAALGLRQALRRSGQSG